MSRLDGRVAIVTGCNTGLGFHTARQLARQGAHLIMAVRSPEKGGAARERILKEHKEAKVEVMQLDLCSFRSIRAFAAAFLAKGIPLHILVNNAGVYDGVPATTDGLNGTYQSNYLGHFLLVELLLPILKKSAPSRIVNVSSQMHRLSTTDFHSAATRQTAGGCSYRPSKLAQVLHTAELQRRYARDGVTAIAVSPGAVFSDIWRWVPKPIMPFYAAFMKLTYLSAEQGSATSLYAARAPAPESDELIYVSPYPVTRCCPTLTDVWGLPWARPAPAPAARVCYDAALARQLWEDSLKLIKDAEAGVYLQELKQRQQQQRGKDD